MKKIPTMLALISVAIITSQAKELSLNLKAGQVYRQVHSTQIDCQLDIQNQSFSIWGDFDLEVDYVVQTVKDDAYEMQMIIQNIRGNLSSDQFSIQFDTLSEQANSPTALLKAIVHKPIEYTMSKTGKMLKMPDLANFNADFNLAKDSVLSKVIEEAMTSNSNAFAQSIYPDHAVSKGDTWTSSTKLPGTEVEIVQTYVWKSSKGGKDIIELSSNDLHFDFSLPVDPVNKVMIRLQLEGSMAGTFDLNKKSGWIEASENRMEAQCQLTLSPEAQSSEEVIIPLKIKVNSKLTQKK